MSLDLIDRDTANFSRPLLRSKDNLCSTNQLGQIRTILAEFDRCTLKLSTDIPQISQSLVIYYQLFDLLQVVQDREGKFRDFDADRGVQTISRPIQQPPE